MSDRTSVHKNGDFGANFVTERSFAVPDPPPFPHLEMGGGGGRLSRPLDKGGRPPKTTFFGPSGLSLV